MNQEDVIGCLIVVVGLVGVLILVALVCAYPTMLLWNWLIPDIFGLTTITFWQALGLNFLCAILFKNGSSSSNKSKDK